MKRINFENTMYAFTALGIATFSLGLGLFLTIDFQKVSSQSSAPSWFLPVFLILLSVIGLPIALFRMGT